MTTGTSVICIVMGTVAATSSFYEPRPVDFYTAHGHGAVSGIARPERAAFFTHD